VSQFIVTVELLKAKLMCIFQSLHLFGSASVFPSPSFLPCFTPIDLPLNVKTYTKEFFLPSGQEIKEADATKSTGCVVKFKRYTTAESYKKPSYR